MCHFRELGSSWARADVCFCGKLTLKHVFVLIDRMKDAVIAKLANQAADFYGEAFKQCQYKDTLPKVSE